MNLGKIFLTAMMATVSLSASFAYAAPLVPYIFWESSGHEGEHVTIGEVPILGFGTQVLFKDATTSTYWQWRPDIYLSTPSNTTWSNSICSSEGPAIFCIAAPEPSGLPPPLPQFFYYVDQYDPYTYMLVSRAYSPIDSPIVSLRSDFNGAATWGTSSGTILYWDGTGPTLPGAAVAAIVALGARPALFDSIVTLQYPVVGGAWAISSYDVGPPPMKYGTDHTLLHEPNPEIFGVELIYEAGSATLGFRSSVGPHDHLYDVDLSAYCSSVHFPRAGGYTSRTTAQYVLVRGHDCVDGDDVLYLIGTRLPSSTNVWYVDEVMPSAAGPTYSGYNEWITYIDATGEVKAVLLDIWNL